MYQSLHTHIMVVKIGALGLINLTNTGAPSINYY